MDSIGEWLTVLSSVGALVTALGALYLGLKKRPSEIRVMDADAAEKISHAANTLVGPLQTRLAAMEVDLGEACTEIEALKKKVGLLETENQVLREWAGRLVHQVQSLGGKPVEMGKVIT